MNGFLLDTHALIWWLLGDPRLTAPAQAAIEDENNRIVVSSVSVYEIANKQRSGRLPALSALLTDLDDAVVSSGFLTMPLSSQHAARAGLLPGDHRDPFDRMIAAQGLVEQMTIVTRDRAIAAFGCKVIW